MRLAFSIGFGVMALAVAACSDDGGGGGAVIRNNICYVDAVSCEGGCATYDEDIDELRATACPSDPSSVSVGTCGAYRFTSSGGYSGSVNYYDTGGALVASYSFNDTPVATPCGATASGVYMGPELRCTRAATGSPCATNLP